MTVKKYLEKIRIQERELFESTEMVLLNQPEVRVFIPIVLASQGPLETAAWALLVDWDDIHKQSVDGVSLRSQELDVWITAKTIQIHHNGNRVALHNRSHHPGLYITKNEHYPPAQQAYAEATPAFVERQLSSGRTFLKNARGVRVYLLRRMASHSRRHTTQQNQLHHDEIIGISLFF